MRSGSKKATDADLQKELGIELADMIHYIVAIAAINNIDLTSIILEKDRKASIKYNHTVNLETFISTHDA
jgi:NTP pyrophosphatase (non-canonical NTP hydrolase)